MSDTAISLKGLPLLFVDDAGVEAKDGLARTVHVARTLSEPVMAPEQEGERVYLYGSVYAEGDGLAMWYQAIVSSQKGTDWVCLAKSKDGLRWEKPALNVLPDAPYANAVYKTHCPSVLFDPWEKRAERRYKMVGASKDKGVSGYVAAWSPDGVHWTSHPGNPILTSSDTVTMTQNPVTGEILVYHKRMAKVLGAGHRRTVWLSKSMDFETWSEPEMVFAADAEDDAWGGRTDVYDMSVVPHAAGFIGFPTMFRIYRQREKETVAPGQSGADGPIDVQLTTSADGVNWKRTWPRVNVIPRGEPGTFDAGLILGTASTTVDVGDETWMYYTALNTGHGAPMDAKRMCIARAAWRRDGYVSLDADPVGGYVVTKPVHFGTEGLYVNADVSRGWLRVGLCETDGTFAKGFEPEACEVFKGNATRRRVKWNSGEKVPMDRDLKVRVEFSAGRLFGISAG